MSVIVLFNLFELRWLSALKVSIWCFSSSHSISSRSFSGLSLFIDSYVLMYLFRSDSAASINLSLSFYDTLSCSASSKDFSRYFCASCSNFLISSLLLMADSATDRFYILASFFSKLSFLADKLWIILSLSSTSMKSYYFSLTSKSSFSAND
jgi:hypothetical protein